MGQEGQEEWKEDGKEDQGQKQGQVPVIGRPIRVVFLLYEYRWCLYTMGIIGICEHEFSRRRGGCCRAAKTRHWHGRPERRRVYLINPTRRR